MAGVEFPAALGLAQMDPVGGAIAGVAEAGGAERFQQDRSDALALLPVVEELALEAGEQVRGQRGETDPGLDTQADPHCTFRRALPRSPCISVSIHLPASGSPVCGAGPGSVTRSWW